MRARTLRGCPFRSRRGSMLLEAIFALFLLGVVALATLALLAQSLAHFEVAESRGRALPVAGSWLEAAGSAEAAGEIDTLATTPVGPGELRWGPGGGVEFIHPRVGRWPVPAPAQVPGGSP